MRIGIDARLWNETGVGKYIRSLISCVARIDRKNEYCVFLLKKDSPSFNLPNDRWHKVIADVHWHSLAEQILLPGLFLSYNLDLVHFPYFSFPILYPKKYVLTVHDLIIDHFKTGRDSTLPAWKYLIKKLAYKIGMTVGIMRALKIIAVSQTTKEEIVTHYKIPAEKIVVIYEAGIIGPKELPVTVRRIRDLGQYMLYVGNAHPHKNLSALIDIWAKMEEVNPELKLVLVGGDGFFYDRIKILVKERKLEKSIIFTGDIPHELLPSYYQNARGFISASLMEGFGLPPLEAMEHQIPVFLADTPIFREICQKAAWYFDPKKAEETARGINNVLSNNNKVRNMIKRGTEVARQYSWDKMAQKTVEIYEKIGHSE